MADAATPITFHARLRTGGRIIVPKVDRDASGLGEGDLVEVTVKRVAEPTRPPGEGAAPP